MHRMIVLDEVDQLDSRGQEVLYTLFEWPALSNSKLLLIGMSLALPKAKYPPLDNPLAKDVAFLSSLHP